MKRWIVTSLAVIAVLAPPLASGQARVKYLMESGYAGPFSDAREVDRSALADARHLARLGNVDAQFAVGAMYHALNDMKSALYWYRRAALFRHPLAAYNLGLIYYEGQAVPHDLEEARRWLMVAAEAGYPPAQTKIGHMVYLGEIPGSGPEDEARWYREAAMAGERLAQYNLGVLYWKGHGVDKDPVRGYAWLALSAPDLDEVATLERIGATLTEEERDQATELIADIESRIEPFELRY